MILLQEFDSHIKQDNKYGYANATNNVVDLELSADSKSDSFEKIEKEIRGESYPESCYGDEYSSSNRLVLLADVLRIIDKYRKNIN